MQVFLQLPHNKIPSILESQGNFKIYRKSGAIYKYFQKSFENKCLGGGGGRTRNSSNNLVEKIMKFIKQSPNKGGNFFKMIAVKIANFNK